MLLRKAWSSSHFDSGHQVTRRTDALNVQLPGERDQKNVIVRISILSLSGASGAVFGS